jgi:hypothetical protein
MVCQIQPEGKQSPYQKSVCTYFPILGYSQKTAALCMVSIAVDYQCFLFQKFQSYYFSVIPLVSVGSISSQPIVSKIISI